MLRSLHIRNLAVLERAAVDFGEGFNVLTGETGAGKSIVVDSLALLAGARAQAESIRTGADVLRVSGVFSSPPTAHGLLEAAGLECEAEELVVRREVHRTGRNRVFINDQPATLKLLSALAPMLLRIHGQREELGLAQPQQQRDWLDRHGGEEAQKLLERCSERYEEWRRIDERLSRLTGERRLRDERIDLIRFQISEIDSARLAPEEDDALHSERDLLRNAEAITAGLSAALEELFDEEGSATERLGSATSRLSAIEDWQPEAPAWGRELEDARLRIDEVVAAARQARDRVESDPQRLEAVEGRLATIERLTRKYGGSVAEVLEYRERVAAELDELRGDADHRDELEASHRAALDSYHRAAVELSKKRESWGRRLVGLLTSELEELSMPAARFEVQLEHQPREGSPLLLDGRAIEFGAAGIDRVGFLFSPNPGEELRPLAKVASGGELSRVYLALQLIARGDDSMTLVFDEVDSGVGGVEGTALGRKLQRLADGSQVLTVTHLPQVAGLGDHHYQVSKEVSGERTFVEVRLLDDDDRIREISRMLGDEGSSEVSRSHAEALLSARRERQVARG